MSEELMTRVQDLIENMINPAVAGHGGFAKDLARVLAVRCDWGPQYIADACKYPTTLLRLIG